MVDCGDCWMDDTFNGCHLTSDECLLATGFQEDSNKIVAIKNEILKYHKILVEYRELVPKGQSPYHHGISIVTSKIKNILESSLFKENGEPRPLEEKAI